MKKPRKEVLDDIPGSGGIMEMMDIMFLPAFDVTAAELDYISLKMSDEELDILVSAIPSKSTASFSTRRKALEIRDKYLNMYHNE